MLLGVVARAFRRVADAAGFEFEAALGSPTATVAYQGQAASVDVETGLGSPFGAKGHQGSADAYAFDAALGSPTAITGKTGNPDAFAIATGIGSPTATVAHQGSPAAIDVVTALGEPSTGYVYTNTEAQTFEDNADTTGWDDAFRSDLDTLIGALKTAGVWSKLDFLFLHDTPNQADSLRDVIDPTRTATAVNSPTFTAGQGFTGDGSTSYINTNYNASTDATNYARNSASYFVWVRTIGAGFGYVFGAQDSSSNVTAPFRSGTGFTTKIDGPHGGRVDSGVNGENSTGLIAGNRSGASALQGYVNGSSVGTNTTSSGSVVNEDFYVCGYNNNGSADSSDDQVAISGAGGSLTAAEHSDLYDALNTYRTARESA